MLTTSTAAPDEPGRFEPFPLTPVQAAYWVGRDAAYELGGVSAHAFVELTLPALDPSRLERAIARLIDRHDALRTTVTAEGTQLVARAAPPVALPVVDLRGTPAEARAAALDALRAELAHQVLPVDRLPTFAVRLARLDDGWRVFAAIDAIAVDAPSQAILARELLAAYASDDALPAAPAIRFRDLVAQAARDRASAIGEAAWRWWLERLASLPPAPVLPLVGMPTLPRFAVRERVLDAPRWDRFRAACAARGFTPVAGLLAAYVECLATFARQPRFTLALAQLDRPRVHPDVDGVVGDFTRLMLLGCEGFAGTPAETARQLAREIELGAAHASVSAVEVLRELARRTPGRALAPFVFTSLLGTGTGELLHGPHVLTASAPTPQVLLEHAISDGKAGLYTTWHVVEDAFPAGLIDGLWDAYHGLLGRLAEGLGWDEVPVLAPAKDLAVVRARNATTASEPGLRLEAGVFAAAARWPEHTAVVSAGRRLTYREVAERSRGVAWELVGHGVRPGELVAVVMEKGWEQVVGVLAVLAAGGAYVPVDPSWPTARVTEVLARASVRLALAHGRTVRRVEWPAGVEVIDVEQVPARADGPPAPTEVHTLAYVIFTSGSTGHPKGVMIDHRGAGNTLADLNRRHAVGPGDVVLGVSSLTFDLSVYDIFGTLWAGATLVQPGSDAARSPDQWLALVAAEGVTIWDSVPALMELLVDEAERADRRGALRSVWMSGDWIPVGLPDRIRAVWPDAKVISMGGATEGSIWSIEFPIERVDPAWRSIPYGHALANQTMWVLDERGRPRPTWVPGEIHIGGVGVALGYLGAPDLTAERFVEVEGLGRLYRTGDWGRLLPSGELEFLGRVDGQVKIGGLRIEVGEIEAALLGHPAVKEAVVVAREDRPGVRRLVAYVVPSEPVDIDELARAIAVKLPSYMMPAVWVGLEALPLSMNGKVDRAALPAPDAITDGGEEPETALEERVAAIWARALGRPHAPADRTFFELGGTSLGAMRMLATIGRELGVELPLGALLGAAGTVRGLASAIAGGQTKTY